MTTTMHPGTRADDRLLTPAFLLLALGELAYFVADGMALYLVPVFAAGPVGSDRVGVGLAFGAFAVSALLLRPLAGRLADERGRRPLLVGGALVAAVALALTAHADGLATTVALRLLAGVGEAGVFVATFAAVADLAPPSRLGEAISFNSLALYLGIAAGPPLGELLVERLGFTAAWYGAAGVALLAAAALVLVGETGTPGSGSRHPLIHRPSLPLALGFLASIVAMGGFLAFVGLHAESIGLESASVPLVVYGLVVVVGRIVFARVPDRVPPLRLAAFALALMASGLVAVAVFGTPVGLVAGTTVLALGVTFSTPAFFTAIFSATAPAERGAAAATASAAIDLGLGGGPIVLGFVAEAAGIPWAFGAGAGVAVAGAVWVLTLLTARAAGHRPATSC